MNARTWSPVTIPAYDNRLPREVDPREKPLDFVLTQSERSKVASMKVALEDNRRRLNREEFYRLMEPLA